MSEKTEISWCDSTVNFWSGCTKVSAGCANCYAEALSNRQLGNIGKWGKGAPRRLHESAFKLALRLKKFPFVCDECGIGCKDLCDEESGTKWACGECSKDTWHHRRRIFSLSLGDWLDDEVPIGWLARMLGAVRQCDQVTWILCTKRPENFETRLDKAWGVLGGEAAEWVNQWRQGNPPSNIILLASVENQEADKRIPELLKIPAACRGLSLEPLLGPVSLDLCSITMAGEISWCIIGGESGPHARPCNVEWIRSLVEQGNAAGVATFVKQFSGRKSGEQGELPDELFNVKQFPTSEWPNS